MRALEARAFRDKVRGMVADDGGIAAVARKIGLSATAISLAISQKYQAMNRMGTLKKIAERLTGGEVETLYRINKNVKADA